MRQVTVLGSCGAFPEPGRACSGFAVDWDGYRLVLDLGYAALPRLLAHWPDGVLDAVAITHEHPDHCIDPHGLFRMRFYGTPAQPRLPLYCPPGVLSRLAGLEPDVDLTAVFDPHPLPGTYRAGPFELTGVPLPHFVPNAGIRVQAGQIALAYSGAGRGSEGDLMRFMGWHDRSMVDRYAAEFRLSLPRCSRGRATGCSQHTVRFLTQDPRVIPKLPNATSPERAELPQMPLGPGRRSKVM